MEVSIQIPRPTEDYTSRVAFRYIGMHDMGKPVKARLGKCQRVLESIIRIYYGAYYTRLRFGERYMQAFEWLPPSDPTNGQIKCTVKLQRQSIINHRKFLMTAGLTHETQVKGEKVQLYIHPQLLVENPVEAQKKQWEKFLENPINRSFWALMSKI